MFSRRVSILPCTSEPTDDRVALGPPSALLLAPEVEDVVQEYCTFARTGVVHVYKSGNVPTLGSFGRRFYAASGSSVSSFFVESSSGNSSMLNASRSACVRPFSR